MTISTLKQNIPSNVVSTYLKKLHLQTISYCTVVINIKPIIELVVNDA